MESRLSVTFSLLAADPVSAGGGSEGGPQVSHQSGREKSHLPGPASSKGRHHRSPTDRSPLFFCLAGRLELTKGAITLTAKRRVSLEGIRGVLGVPCNKRATAPLENRGSPIMEPVPGWPWTGQPVRTGAPRMTARCGEEDLISGPTRVEVGSPPAQEAE